VRNAILILIDIYQRFIRPFLAPHCRFQPSCSAFAREAVLRHGAARGTWLALNRVLRCHPFAPGGIDPVPGAPRRAGRT
jgi:putative membrane protein insertion efficiency factor